MTEQRKIGPYQILNEIGAGGMGRVFKAVDSRTSRTVALKVIKADLAEEKVLKRFMREMRITESLKHPNIIAVHDIQEQRSPYYFTMDFVEGSSLTVLSKRRIKPQKAAQLMLKVVAAVAYAHDQGVIHRDIKPANIMIDKSNKPILMDFGLAKAAESTRLTASMMVMGSIHYMSPEQADSRQNEIDEISDIYSLGAVLYELITGKLLFEGRTFDEIMPKIFFKQPERPRDINSAIPVGLEAICLKALQKKKEDRYQSAEEMALDLELFLAGKKVSAAASSLVPLVTWLQSNKKLLLVNVVLLAIIIAVILLAKS